MLSELRKKWRKTSYEEILEVLYVYSLGITVLLIIASFFLDHA